MMKYFLIVPCLLVVVCAVSEDFKSKAMEKMIGIADKCIPLVGATDEDVAELMAHQVPSRKEGKCLIACFTKEFGAIKDGKPSKEGTLAALEPLKADDPEIYGKIAQAVEKCQVELEKLTDIDECELALQATMCLNRESKELGVDGQSLMG